MKKKKKTSHQLEWAIAILASISTILGTLIVLYQFCAPQLKSKVRKPDLRKAVLRSISEKDILVLVAPFESQGSLKFDVSGRLIEKLRSAFQDVPEIRVEFYPDSIPKDDPYAIGNLGWRLGVFALIQGSYDDAGIRPNFILPRTFRTSLLDTLPSFRHDHAIAWELGLIEETSGDSLIFIQNGKAFEDFPLSSKDLAEYIRNTLPEQCIYLVGLTAGMRLYRLGEMERAFGVLNRCIEHATSASLAWGLASAYFYRGCIFESKNNPEEAVKDFSKTLELDRAHLGAHFHLANLSVQSKQWQLALNEIEQALFLYQKFNSFLRHWVYPSIELADLYFLYGQALEGQGGKDSLAVYYLNQFVRSARKIDSTRMSKGYESLGNIYLRQKKYFEAINAFHTAMRWDSTQSQPYFGLGISLWYARHDTFLARKFLQQYLTLEKDTARLAQTRRDYGFLFSR